MVIYGEYLFIENLITGMVILFFTGKILGVKMKPLPIFFCGCCCGAYAFILFVPLHGMLSLACKGAFSLLMAFLAYGARTGRKLLRGSFVFLGVTVCYGGITMAIITSFHQIGVTAAAGVYLPPMTYLAVTAAAIGAALFLLVILEILKNRRMEARRYLDAEVLAGGKSWVLKGLIDSGNDLKEPITGRPVSIVNREKGRQMTSEMKDAASRYTLVPYRAVGVSHGMLEGFRTDAIRFGDGRVIKGAVIALCDEDHFCGREDEMEILLPASLLERGIYGDI